MKEHWGGPEFSVSFQASIFLAGYPEEGECKLELELETFG